MSVVQLNQWFLISVKPRPISSVSQSQVQWRLIVQICHLYWVSYLPFQAQQMSRWSLLVRYIFASYFPLPLCLVETSTKHPDKKYF